MPQTETIRFYRPADLPGIEVLAVDHSDRLWRWFHQAYAVSTPTKSDRGWADWFYRGRKHLAGPGLNMLLEPGETHQISKISYPSYFRATLIPPPVMEKMARELGMEGALPHLKAASSPHPGLYRVFQGLHESLEGPATALERQSRFTEALRLLLEVAAEKGPETLPARPLPQAVRRAADFLKEHWDKDVSLGDLAAASRVSRFHLVRLFTRQTGIPPHAYQIQLRLSWARKFLSQGMSLSQTAVETGFTDQAHFSKCFKSNLGVTPSQYAAQTAPPRRF